MRIQRRWVHIKHDSVASAHTMRWHGAPYSINDLHKEISAFFSASSMWWSWSASPIVFSSSLVSSFQSQCLSCWETTDAVVVEGVEDNSGLLQRGAKYCHFFQCCIVSSWWIGILLLTGNSNEYLSLGFIVNKRKKDWKPSLLEHT